MTREEILALEGLELRKAVAEARRLRIVVVVDPEVVGVYLQGGGDCPAFESNIAAAWPLAEERRFTLTPTHSGWEVFQRTNSGNICGDICYVGTMSSQKWTFGRTAPEAICRAYLLAKAVQP